MTHPCEPGRQGLYDPAFERDACGVAFVADLQARKSHQIVQQALQALVNLDHRGACGCETNTGDGAGILLQTPHAFLEREAAKAGIRLPAYGEYGVGMIFLPPDAQARRQCEALIEKAVADEGQRLLGWRTVPTSNATLGPTAKAGEPVVRQVFIGRAAGLADPLAFERKLFVIRRRAENAVKASAIPQRGLFYVPSLSYRTIVYKGMLRATQVPEYYPDLLDPAVDSALAMVHSRFSTNTFPNWARAHPYRFLCHNGEINTLRGNINWMHARERMFQTPLLGDDVQKVLPVVDTDGSDSAMFDNVLELLALTGRELPHAMMMMIPEPWSGHESMPEAKRAFYEYHSALMEPWDGPALVAFTDGHRIAASLDRNGLRPARYYVTKDDLVVLASEAGVLDIPPDRVRVKGRLQPGRMFVVDLDLRRIVSDDEIKRRIAQEKPYKAWVKDNLVPLEALPEAPPAPHQEEAPLLVRQHAFGFTTEDVKILVTPMAQDGVEPIGSMGTDTPIAVLSERPQLLYNYFKQLFAQVTNPPVDAIREEIIMATDTTIGAERNLLDPKPESCRQIRLKNFVLQNDELEKLRALDGRAGFKAVTLPALYDVAGGGEALEAAMDALCRRASEAVAGGADLLILSDRGVSPAKAPIPALLACAGVHHHLIREGSRTRAALIVESGEPREVHQFAMLLGYGAGAINPYLTFETIKDLVHEGAVQGVDGKTACKNYAKAVVKGCVKVISKMGISTIQSYRGAQIFEAIGLSQDLVDKYFTWTASRVGGVGIDVLARETRMRHERAFPARPTNGHVLDAGGQYQWRREGEAHLFNPETIHRLQYACRTGSYKVFQEYSELVNNQSKRLCTLRGLMDMKFPEKGVPIEEVESVDAIVKRFKTGAMSYGSISKEAHEGLAVAMNRIGGKSNTGEGGEDPKRYLPETADEPRLGIKAGDTKNSAIKQVASGRFGVTSSYLVNAQELQIKIAQGAKPGEGGQLPGSKVYPWIAKVRHATPGVGLISPPPHHDIYSIEDLAELIYDLKCSNDRARISVKLVAEVGVGTVAAGVAKAKADVVLISGFDGGTGASPLTSIKHAGIPWELGLAETQQVLLLNNLRSRIRVEADGQLKTGRDVVVAALLGAEEFGFATAPLVVMGCIMMRVCHLNTCPVGVATQDPKLRAKFTGDPAHVVNFMRFIAQEVRELMAKLGFRTLEETVGRADLLEMRPAVEHWKAAGLDFSQILYRPPVGPGVGRFATETQDHGLESTIDKSRLMELCRPALEKREAVAATLPIRNVNRTVGTILGAEVTRRWGFKGLPDGTIRLHFQGSAGQSFGAFVPRGMTLELEGDANDYLGKGLSGGRITVYPSQQASFAAEENVIIGNVALYGATDGEVYIRGLAGERFAVRNSGANAVVEGVGDHGCEYMTGGRVVILGPTGRNFAAGMSGGIAYVLDEDGTFAKRCNPSMVGLSPLEDPEEVEKIRWMVRRHADLTQSQKAWKVLALWESILPKFVKVLPHDFKRALEAEEKVRALGLSEDEAEMKAFEMNAMDKAARVGGN
jgi:glutamate synthase domain-containing protein 2/glutamate synthase domain-containing protein 1/glutamate synthase domain-containing protein 3